MRTTILFALLCFAAPISAQQVPLSTYETIIRADEVTMFGAETYQNMARTYARACGTTEADIAEAWTLGIKLYRDEGVRPRGRLAEAMGVASQMLQRGQKGDATCRELLAGAMIALMPRGR